MEVAMIKHSHIILIVFIVGLACAILFTGINDLREQQPTTQPFFFKGQLVQFIGQDPENNNKMIIISHGRYDAQLKEHTYHVRDFGELLRVWEHELRAVGQAEKPAETAKVR
jgi:hypothetical protein